MDREALAGRIASFVRSCAAEESPRETFDDLALAIHRYQHARDATVRALAPEPAATPAEIPAVPVGLFKELDVGTVRPHEPHVAFHTSGTTAHRPGIHRLRDTALYDLGAQLHARRWLPRTTRTLALLRDGKHSSLAHMVRGFAPYTGPVRFLVDEALDTTPLRSPEATFVCATAFALDAWMAEDPAPLAEGSAIMVTGGFKGHTHTLEADALVTRASRCAPVLLEYGMTELSSQLWAHANEPYTAPGWLRVTAVDPVRGTPVAPGERGQLRFVDLCNLDSTVCIETLDEGRVHPDGRVELLGRLPGSPVRGCSVSVEDLLG